MHKEITRNLGAPIVVFNQSFFASRSGNCVALLVSEYTFVVGTDATLETSSVIVLDKLCDTCNCCSAFPTELLVDVQAALRVPTVFVSFRSVPPKTLTQHRSNPIEVLRDL